MSRLTWKKENGEWGLKGYDIKKVPRELYGYMCKLKDYEENELTEEKKQAIDDAYSEQAREISELKKRIMELEKENNDLRTILEKLNGATIQIPEKPIAMSQSRQQFMNRFMKVE